MSFPRVSNDEWMRAVMWVSLLTEEEHIALDILERKHRKSMPRLTMKELLDIYPTGRTAVIRALRAEIKRLKKEISGLSEYRDIWYDGCIRHAKPLDQHELTKWLDESIDHYRERYERQLQRCAFDLRWLQGDDVPLNTKGVTKEEITRAKQYPINQLLKVGRNKKTTCFWHDDKHASLHVYDTRVYCFACNHADDAIGVFIALNGGTFVNAVKTLST